MIDYSKYTEEPLIKYTKEPLIEAWCIYKWHYKTFEEHQKAFDNNEFGLQTLVAFYPTRVYLMNNYDDTQQLDKRGIEWDKYISYSELKDMLHNGSIGGEGLYDWE
tara:strand:+ start:265 stop:582 length:318 start_codon:yes stop_codon:yes gene_type:complete